MGQPEQRQGGENGPRLDDDSMPEERTVVQCCSLTPPAKNQANATWPMLLEDDILLASVPTKVKNLCKDFSRSIGIPSLLSPVISSQDARNCCNWTACFRRRVSSPCPAEWPCLPAPGRAGSAAGGSAAAGRRGGRGWLVGRGARRWRPPCRTAAACPTPARTAQHSSGRQRISGRDLEDWPGSQDGRKDPGAPEARTGSTKATPAFAERTQKASYSKANYQRFQVVPGVFNEGPRN